MGAGSYTLVMDTDASLCEEALDVLYTCLPDAREWDLNQGGAATYLVRTLCITGGIWIGVMLGRRRTARRVRWRSSCC